MHRVVLFFLLSMVIVGCSKPSPEEYLTKAQAAREARNLTQALEEYEKLISDYPGTPEAEEALFQIASVQNNDMREFTAAIAAYKRYLDQYPQGKHAPVAMFLTGYVYHNELNDTVAAKAAYQRFMATFPNHQLAASVAFELKNLGKKPEEIIPLEPQVTAAPEKKSAAKN